MMGCSDLLGVRVRGGRAGFVDSSYCSLLVGFFSQHLWSAECNDVIHWGSVCVCVFTVAEMHVYWMG